ncbi:MAG: nitrate- and nitrite sensing domain-containing protein [Gemmatimonadaceae bacterium]|nr:nitrate- and nitrite sensing domain-containing protein [Gemmatimonadaceae bacterium]
MRTLFSGLRGKLTLAAGLPLLIAIAFAGVVVKTQYGRWQQGRDLERIAILEGTTTALIHEMQAERGLSAGYIASGGTRFAPELAAQRLRADSVRDLYRASMATTRIARLSATAVRIESAIDSAALTRAAVDSRQIAAPQVQARYSAFIAVMRQGINDFTRDVTDGDARVALRQIDAVGHLKEWAARERGALNSVLTLGAFSDNDVYRDWITAVAGQEIALEQLRNGATDAVVARLKAMAVAPEARRIAAIRDVAYAGVGGASVKADPAEWFSTTTVQIQAQRAIEVALTDTVAAHARDASTSALTTLVLVLVTSLCVLLVSILTATQTIRHVLRVTMRVTDRAQQVQSQLLVQIQDVLSRLSRGQFEGTIDDDIPLLAIRSNDELGTMAGSLDGMITASRGTGVAVALVQDTMRSLVKTSRQMADSAVAGSLTVRANPDEFEGEFRELVQELNRMLDAIETPLSEAKRALEKMANRDLEVRMLGTYQGDYDAIAQSVNTAAEQLSVAMRQVRQSVYQVSDASEDIASTSETLAHNAQRQAQAIEAVDHAAQDLAQLAERVAASASEVTALAGSARANVQDGTRVASDLGEAITRIKESSDATSRVVKTIDEIAFQTNLLALNAAVEAARAGDAGRGFAVVAEEVRALALRSAEAARSTSAMIEAAVQDADRGVTLRDDVQRVLGAIATAVERVDEMAAGMTREITSQRDQVRDITGRMSELNSLAQSVAAGAEEGASGAEEMRAQAARLGDAAKGFKTRDWANRDRREPTGRGGATKRPPVPAARPPARPAPALEALDEPVDELMGF